MNHGRMTYTIYIANSNSEETLHVKATHNLYAGLSDVREDYKLGWKD